MKRGTKINSILNKKEKEISKKQPKDNVENIVLLKYYNLKRRTVVTTEPTDHKVKLIQLFNHIFLLNYKYIQLNKITFLILPT